MTEEFMQWVYSGLEVLSGERYFENVLNAVRFWTRKAFSEVDRRSLEYMADQSKGFDTTMV